MQEIFEIFSLFPALFSAFCDFAITSITYLSLTEDYHFMLITNCLYLLSLF